MMEVLSIVIRAQFHPAKPCILSRTALTNRGLFRFLQWYDVFATVAALNLQENDSDGTI